jgi:hypothetical protein
MITSASLANSTCLRIRLQKRHQSHVYILPYRLQKIPSRSTHFSVVSVTGNETESTIASLLCINRLKVSISRSAVLQWQQCYS